MNELLCSTEPTTSVCLILKEGLHATPLQSDHAYLCKTAHTSMWHSASGTSVFRGAVRYPSILTTSHLVTGMPFTGFPHLDLRSNESSIVSHISRKAISKYQ